MRCWSSVTLIASEGADCFADGGLQAVLEAQRQRRANTEQGRVSREIVAKTFVRGEIATFQVAMLELIRFLRFLPVVMVTRFGVDEKRGSKNQRVKAS